jgi:DNA-binding MarR family transcriptional regulator
LKLSGALRSTRGKALEIGSDLTSGAATRMLDRLERIGYVRRLPDRGDRRRVLVELTPRARKLARELYGSFEAAGAGLRRYDRNQLALLRYFLEGSCKLYEQQAGRLSATQKRSESTK